MKLFSIALMMLALAAGACTTNVSAARTVAVAEHEAAVDAIFSRWSPATPGCAVGISTNGAPALAKGYGMADLEHDVPIAPETIFEAGSVSKQFTAAAVLLLARDGKLSLDDPVRKYIPELPDYATASPTSGAGSSASRDGDSRPLTIRHMLTHTSGLRDWGSVTAIAGWPRTTRVHTHAHVLDIVSRQRALNFPPGTRWSYSNTGFNLAAIIVSRVSGRSFADFTRDRLFTPLGMTHTSWRDDYTRIVKQRAIAYAEREGAYHTDMPFENVHGNGGLLTTVGDLLKWNENFTKPVVGDAAFVAEQQRPGHFADGRAHGYALGLFVGTYKGLREVSHSGSTAGYNAFLTRFPDQKVSVAVLCNATIANATQFAHRVAEIYLGDSLKPVKATPSYTLTPADVARLSGLYRNLGTGAPAAIVAGGDFGLRLENGPSLVPESALVLSVAAEERLTFDGNGGLTTVDPFGTTDRLERVAPGHPTAPELQAYAGVYESDEAEAVFTAKVEGDQLVLAQRPDRRIVLTPLYADAFRNRPLGTVIFRRDGDRRVVGFSINQDRVWDLRFRKTNAPGAQTAAGRP